ncbi:MAG: helix-turn-helix transcriptional regulator [Alphaproteobacteria bacterium]|nr:helix-turn-helix transcriptional regulator [Alphaproteobacteria bacterium]MBE8220399.1 helix-turn-helix transcriptional regulator [Alphaproteobacteria bacterium]
MPRKRQRALDAYIGARLRLRRLMLGMSQEALGSRLALTFQQVQKYEKGTNRISASRLFELARVLDVPVQYFYDGIDEDPNTALDEESAYEGLNEDGSNVESVSPYLEFISSSEGVRLNQSFLTIDDKGLRRQILGVMTEMARVATEVES